MGETQQESIKAEMKAESAQRFAAMHKLTRLRGKLRETSGTNERSAWKAQIKRAEQRVLGLEKQRRMREAARTRAKERRTDTGRAADYEALRKPHEAHSITEIIQDEKDAGPGQDREIYQEQDDIAKYCRDQYQKLFDLKINMNDHNPKREEILRKIREGPVRRRH